MKENLVAYFACENSKSFQQNLAQILKSEGVKILCGLQTKVYFQVLGVLLEKI